MKSAARHSSTGFTLIELLVAMALSLVVAIAAVASLLIAKQGFTAVDATSQLRDNARFASDLLQRVIVQSGYMSVNYAANTRETSFSVNATDANPEPHIFGVDSANLNLPEAEDADANPTVDPRSNCQPALGIACNNLSDVLFIRYQSSPAAMDEAKADGTMINCAGIPETVVPQNKNDRVVSILHITNNVAGPALSCTYKNDKGVWTTQPMVEGVDSFQVLYGIDGFTTGFNVPFTGTQDGVPDKYVRASDMTVGNDLTSVGTRDNWRRVRSVRIGLVLRGAENSASFGGGLLAKLCPLGVLDAAAAAQCVDESGVERPPLGAEFPPNNLNVQNDGRLRTVTTFTVHLRNFQINN
ncbi:MAG: PilW family protein [Rhodoferax sp.]|nr:PilW family protein [Rhodoferax sp.]